MQNAVLRTFDGGGDFDTAPLTAVIQAVVAPEITDTAEARIGEIDKAINELIKLQSTGAESDFGGQFERLYAEKKALKQQVAEMAQAANHSLAEQSRFDEIFAAVDAMQGVPPEWDEVAVR